MEAIEVTRLALFVKDPQAVASTPGAVDNGTQLTHPLRGRKRFTERGLVENVRRHEDCGVAQATCHFNTVGARKVSENDSRAARHQLLRRGESES